MSKRLRSSFTLNTLLELSHKYYTYYLNSEIDVFVQLRDNEDWYHEWTNKHKEALEGVAESDNTNQQILNLRMATVKQIEAASHARPFIENNLAAEDKIILGTILYKDMPYEELINLNYINYVFSSASCSCMRGIASEMGDRSNNDWFAMYQELYKEYVKLLYGSIIAEEKGESYALSHLLESFNELIKERKPKIFDGYNFFYKKEEIDESP